MHQVVEPQEPEKQLSKKELKRREMEELDKALAELGTRSVRVVINESTGMDNEQSQAAAEQSAAEIEQATPVEGATPADGKKKRSRGGKKKKPSVEESEPSSSPAAAREGTTLDPELRGALNENGSLDSDAVAKMLAARHGSSKKKNSGANPPLAS